MKINAVLLAAGNSRRFGENKLLYELEGKPMYRHILDTVCDCGGLFNKIVVVTQYDEIIEGVEAPMLWVRNSHSERGMSHSIQLGIEADPEAEGWMFLTCDQPHIRKESLIGFMEAFMASGKQIGSMCWEGGYGIPAIFLREHLPELQALSGDVGGRSIINRHKHEVHFQPFSSTQETVDYDVKLQQP